MFIIPFCDSGYLKYYADDTAFNYSYTINTFEYPAMHGHLDYWEFCLVTEGRMRNCIPNRGEELYEARTLSFMTTSEHHAFFKAAPNIRYINISVRESHLLRLLELISPDFKELLLRGPRCFPASEMLIAEVEKLLHQCNLLQEDQTEQKNGLLCSAVLLILQELNRIHWRIQESQAPFVQKIREISKRPEFVRYSVGDLRRELSYSSAHLNRLFQEHFGVSPYEYLQGHKFRYARNLLRNTDMSVTAIAYAIGYTNLSHFFEQFKQRYGTTPGECRRGIGGV